MRKWILLALLGLVLLFAFRMREGVDTTLEPVMSPEIAACNEKWDRVIETWAKGIPSEMPPSSCNEYAPSWISTGLASKTLVDDSNKPTPDTIATASTYVKHEAQNAAESAVASNYATTSGYADILKDIQDANKGPLPTAIDERTGTSDVGATRPMDGPVFNDGGQLGTGQDTASAAAAAISGGNTYDTTPTAEGTLNPYDLWPGTKQQPAAPAGRRLPVDGPSWGGLGAPAVPSAKSTSSQPAPALYGPVGTDKSKNSQDTSMLPSDASAGSDPSNQYAATSRVPGDQDLVPNPYLQSTTFSLANSSQKTDPVPFLADFSAFQK